MSTGNTMRILIADDHPVVRQGLAAMIEREQDMTVVAQVSNGREAVELYREHQPEITLMDLRMPEMDGVTAIATIRDEFPTARIIVLTTYDRDEDIFRALHAGAKGYLLKDAPREELLAAVRAVKAGRTHISPEIGAKFIERSSNPAVTAREVDVLRLIVAGKSNQEIASALFISESTVKTHVNHVLNKLDASDRAQAISIALKRGIVQLE
jgi:two-component system NarL family response regulator